MSNQQVHFNAAEAEARLRDFIKELQQDYPGVDPL
jgi:hypothetical protein